MNRIDKAFAELKAAGKKALITFVTAGDPDLDTTEKAVTEMFGNGADIIELGVPFSDPVAEGPVIQEASLRSLEGGTNLDKIFGIVINIRRKTDKPLLLMMYLNTVFRYGTERFFEKCRMTGIDGVIIPDMPYEEKDEVSAQAKANAYAAFIVRNDRKLFAGRTVECNQRQRTFKQRNDILRIKISADYKHTVKISVNAVFIVIYVHISDIAAYKCYVIAKAFSFFFKAVEHCRKITVFNSLFRFIHKKNADIECLIRFQCTSL